MKKILTLFIFITILTSMWAHMTYYETTLTQPDGTEFEVTITGDQYFRSVADKENYTLIVEPKTGEWMYAMKGRDGLVPSPYKQGTIDPSTIGIEPGLAYSTNQINKRVDEMEEFYSANSQSRTPNTGTFNNLVVFIRFSGESEFNQTLSTYTDMISDTTPGANSMINFFQEASYNQLTIQSHYYPPTSTSYVVSYQDTYPRSYFQPYSGSNTNGYNGDDERGEREFALLQRAVNYIDSYVPTSLNIDADNDGYVDNIVFIVKGNTDGWSDLLWPHRWVLYGLNVYLNGDRVWDFNFQLQNHLVSSGNGVMCHEMFHSVGAPDLYHYSQDNMDPVGQWDLMEATTNPPQHMLMYMKYRYGLWVNNIPEITTSGTYTLAPSMDSANNCYKIASTDSDEYYVLEYRKMEGTFESSLPGEGLVIYRINTNVDGEGNRNGPPDEVYVYRPNGTLTANGNSSAGVFNASYGRTEINDYTNPNGFLSDGSLGGLNISQVTTAGNTISFYANIGGTGAPDVSVSPTSLSASLPPDATGTRTVRITNNGTAPLTYNISLQDGTRNSGGPTTSGYYWLDSAEANGPAYVWNDISSSGTEINFTSDDQISSTINLGFSFPYYENSYSSLAVCGNGFLSFSGTDTEWSNEDIPDSSTPNSYIAPFWDDLSPQQSGSVHYYSDTVNQRFIVQFTNVPHYYTVTGTYTFQVHLYANGEIYFYYNNMQDTVDSATIGMENSDGSEGLKIAYNQSYVTNNRAVLISNVNFIQDDVDWADATPTVGSINPNQYEDVTINIDTAGLSAGSNYTASIVINSNDSDQPSITVPLYLAVTGSLDAPANATARVVNGQMQLKWSPVAGASSYNVFMQNPSNGTYYNRNTYGTFGTEGGYVTWTTIFNLGNVSWDRAFFYIKAVAE